LHRNKARVMQRYASVEAEAEAGSDRDLGQLEDEAEVKTENQVDLNVVKTVRFKHETGVKIKAEDGVVIKQEQ
jgi:hypothetical protein